jgi:surface antigen
MKRAILAAVAMSLSACVTPDPTPRPAPLQLSLRDELHLLDAHDTAFDAGPLANRAIWGNPDSGFGGEVRHYGGHKNADGRDCREFDEVTRSVDGRTETKTGVACLNDTGSLDISYQG